MIEIDDRDLEILLAEDPAGPEPEIIRPNTAPAYYLGRPARLWITVMRPRHRPTTSRHATQADAAGGAVPRDPVVLTGSMFRCSVVPVP